MERVLEIQAAAGSRRQVRLLGYPDECPRCHAKLVPKVIGPVAVGDQDVSDVEEAFQCTNGACQRIFIAIYTFTMPLDTPRRFRFDRAIPFEPSRPTRSPARSSTIVPPLAIWSICAWISHFIAKPYS